MSGVGGCARTEAVGISVADVGLPPLEALPIVLTPSDPQ